MSNESINNEINVGALSEAINEKMDRNLVNADTIGQAILDRKVEVEALLEQNGYAKFTWKNGNKISNLLIQFGLNVSATNVTMQFPVVFTSVKCFLRCNESTATDTISGRGSGYSQLTNTSVSMFCDGGIPKQSWIAVGT